MTDNYSAANQNDLNCSWIDDDCHRGTAFAFRPERAKTAEFLGFAAIAGPAAKFGIGFAYRHGVALANADIPRDRDMQVLPIGDRLTGSDPSAEAIPDRFFAYGDRITRSFPHDGPSRARSNRNRR